MLLENIFQASKIVEGVKTGLEKPLKQTNKQIEEIMDENNIFTI